MWEVGGGDKKKLLWRHYYPQTTGLVFVVDSIDWGRVDENREEI